jgi:hypothetical protein
MNFWIFQDKPNKRIVFIALNAEHAMSGKPLFPREDRGTDRIPTTMRRSAKRNRCLQIKALKSTAAFATPNTRPDDGTGERSRPEARN